MATTAIDENLRVNVHSAHTEPSSVDAMLTEMQISRKHTTDSTTTTTTNAELSLTDENRIRRAPKIRTLGVQNFSRQKLMSSDVIVQCGLLNNLHNYRILPKSSEASNHYLVTDDVVDRFYGKQVLRRLQLCGYKVHKLVMPSGENSKCMAEFSRLVDEILRRGIDKKSFIFSLGGGVVNNMCGMIAATLYRGIGLVHMTTTSMGQVDAAIDFKQAVNSCYGKNLIGAYHPASLILVDPTSLRTLSDRHLCNGLSEAIKHALCQDPALVSYFVKNAAHHSQDAFLDHVVRRTLALKLPTLNADQSDDFNEMVPQYGHCVGHAIEHLSRYSLLHGEAIAIGMCVCAEISVVMGLAESSLIEQHIRVFQAYNLPCFVPAHMTVDAIVDKIRYDKHYTHKEPTMGLLTALGSMHSEEGVCGIKIKADVLKTALKRNKLRGEKSTARRQTILAAADHDNEDDENSDSESDAENNTHNESGSDLDSELETSSSSEADL
mmetsp:Transcript_38590/g.97151  ORF Transcript_38590/g.97151 Transcript_38590/m.97151 type:complete len:493 (-) Transcript_38590:1741-3219(-)|eukprot:CAMPEP_0177641540 /NCGR_PEP_ID=MMETSP0447-20121125/7117_1 /TAXON_ID=0 /ORGANISM="Stygamoeba regulata, Strain BSH-02190019" /LENGTH=492 /DNA_ID=CAMNT_0019143657 /DNA_START=215 /DNA_END=1693 /DNA_ORIENTATION=+